MTRQPPPPAKLWEHVPGVTYPGRNRWDKIPGVQYPGDRPAYAPKTKTAIAQAQARERAKQHRATYEANREHAATAYDAGESARSIARRLKVSADTVAKMIRETGRTVYKGHVPKTGRGGLSVDALKAKQKADNQARKAATEAKVIEAFKAMPKRERSGAKAASAVGIYARWACRILKNAGLKLSTRGQKPKPCSLKKAA